MTRLLIGIGIAAALFASGLFIGYQVATGKEAKKDVKIIVQEVENHNEDQISLQEHTAEVEGLKKQLRAANKRIPLARSDSCPIDELKRVWEQAARNANSLYLSD